MKTIVDLTEELKKYSLEKDTAAKQAVEANIAPVEADASSASRAYVVGEQLFLNDVLYDVTSPISVGDAIVVNTNITAANKLSADIQTLTSAFVNNVNQNGCKNILPNYITPFSSGGAHVAIDDDGIITVTASSALTGNCNIYPVGDSNIEENKKLYLPKGTYIGSGCPSGGSGSTYYVNFYNQSLSANLGYDYGEGVEFTLDRDTWIIVRASVRSGYTISDSVVFKPMITLATDVPSDYAHYVSFAKTNLQLTQDSVSWVDAAHIGAVNWCPNDATTQSISDGTTSFTFTVNSDKSVTVSAPSYPVTLASTISLDLHTFTGNEDFVGKTVKASGGVESMIRLVAYRALTADGSAGSVDIEGDAQIFTWANNGSGTKSKMKIEMMSGKTLSGPVTFKPMITVPSYNGPYVPYAKTNRELTDIVTNKILLTKQSSVKATADGTKTYATLLVEAITALRSVIGNLASNERLKPIRIGIYGLFVMPIAYEIFLDKTNTSKNLNFVGNIVSTNVYQTIQIQANNTGNIYIYRSDNGNIVDRGSEVPTSGHFIEIIYEIYTFT